LKALAAKIDEYTRTVNTLRAKVATLEENNADLKRTFAEKDKESANLEALKGKEEDLNGKILSKDLLIGNLKQTIQDLSSEKSRDTQEKNVLEGKIYRLEAELVNTKEANTALCQNI